MHLHYGRRKSAGSVAQKKIFTQMPASQERYVSRIIINVRGMTAVVVGGRSESKMFRAAPDVNLKIRRIMRSAV